MSNTPQTQTLRFRRPDTANKPQEAPKPNLRHTGLLQDQLRRAQRPPWCPSFSLAVRMLLLIRVSGAMYSNLTDCDEVYNFWEPLHYLDRGYGFQTWEVAPQFAIRSWAYISLFLHPVADIARFLRLDKRATFFGIRILLAFISSVCDAKLYRSVMDNVNYRVGRYLFFGLLFSAGMWNASTALLPSSFAMYTSTLAFSYAVQPPSAQRTQRTLLATVAFAAGAIFGWPFSLALSIPFVLEELFVFGADRVTPDKVTAWFYARFVRLLTAGLAASTLFIPLIAIDSLAYGRLTITPWNIIKYNIFSSGSRGPDLYGTESWTYYLKNLLLNFNVFFPLSLLSLPALAVTYVVDKKRLGSASKPEKENTGAQGSSPFTLLAIRLLPFYLWVANLSAQSHKEERFMFPAYAMLLFNASVTLFLIRGWIEVAYIKVTNSPYQASKSSIFHLVTLAIVLFSTAISISHILSEVYYYHAPQEVVYNFEAMELVRVLNVTGLLPPAELSEYSKKGEKPHYDLTPVKELNITLCLGKEWHRFPSHWLVPDGVNVEFIKSDFDGMLPRHFVNKEGGNWLWRKDGTRHIPNDLNDLNKEDPRHYVDISTCHYLIDLDFPEHPIQGPHEPRYAVDSKWERVHCKPFLDATHSPLLSRILWFPGKTWWQLNSYGDYCLLKKRGIF